MREAIDAIDNPVNTPDTRWKKYVNLREATSDASSKDRAKSSGIAVKQEMNQADQVFWSYSIAKR